MVLDQYRDDHACVSAPDFDALAGDHELAVLRHAALHALGAGWWWCWDSSCCRPNIGQRRYLMTGQGVRKCGEKDISGGCMNESAVDSQGDAGSGGRYS